MAFNKFGKFLLTESGRSFCMYTSLTIGTSVCCLQVLPNTFFLQQFKEIVQLYSDGIGVNVSKGLKAKYEKAIDLVGIAEKDRHLYKPFMVYGFDPYYIGTAHSKFGAFIGIPANFTYTDVDSINKYQIRLNNESIQWELDEGKLLLRSLILSEKAQLYAMAREIKMASSFKFILDTCYRTFSVFMCYGLCMFFNRRFNMIGKPRGVRFTMYGLVAILSFGNYAMLKDFTQVHYEQSVDKFLKEQDPIFIEGGKEFYEQLLSRNKALRKLLGKAGESHYSIMGNENYFLRQRHVPIVHRKAFFEGNETYA